MNHIGKIFALGVALVVAAPLAHATSIDANFGVSGPATYNYISPQSATFAFANSPVPGATFTSFSATGDSTISPYFTAGQSIKFQTNTFSLGPIGTTITLAAPFAVGTTTEGGETLTFYVESYKADYIGSTGANIDGTGYFTETGTVNYTSTAADFSFAPNKAGSSMTFSANTVTANAPEPSSLVLLGSGLVSAAGMLIRRRRIV